MNARRDGGRVDLAERLGFDRPRNIRQLIGRMVEQGFLPGVQTRCTVQRVERRGRAPSTSSPPSTGSIASRRSSS